LYPKIIRDKQRKQEKEALPTSAGVERMHAKGSKDKPQKKQ
jgi:hypothetical protein